MIEYGIESKIANATSANNGWSKPEEYDLGTPLDRKILDKKLDNNEVVSVSDGLSIIAADMFEVNHPDLSYDEKAKEEYVREIEGKGAAYGKWFYFPWSKELVHYPLRDDHLQLRTARNRNLITQEEQQILYASTLAIFGLSVGSNVVDRLVISGIGSKLILADPDTIDATNLNRISASISDLGSYKVDFVAKRVSQVDPYIEQVHFRESVTSEGLASISTEHRPDILFDEVDDLSAKAESRLQASKSAIPVIMATDLGDKSIVDVERHDQKETKPFNGRLDDRYVNALL